MKHIACAGILMALLAGPLPSWGLEELSDQELGNITAGAASASFVEGVLQFQFDAQTRSGLFVEGSGSVVQQVEPLPGGPGSYLIVSDNAQSNQNSFITVNSVNSTISLLVNLNVNINSVVGTVGQSNMSGGF